MRGRGRRTIGFLIWTVSLIVICAFCVTGTVICQSELRQKELEGYYRSKEKELVQETRAYLNQEGFYNSGVMLTKVIDTDGSQEYTITVHHDKIDGLDDNARECLKEELSALCFVADNCSFYHEFLLTD